MIDLQADVAGEHAGNAGDVVSPTVDVPVSFTVVSALAVQISEALPIRAADPVETRIFISARAVADADIAGQQIASA